MSDPRPLLDRGFHIFPKPKGITKKKEAAFYSSSWPSMATNDREKIRKLQERFPNSDWAVATGPSNLVVVDLDQKNGKDGEAKWLELQKKYAKAPKTLVVRTTNGRHLYFRGQCATVVDMRGKIPGIDVRSDGGLVFAPGCTTEDSPHKSPYTWEIDVEIAEAPQWLITLVGQPTVRDREAARIIDHERDVARAMAMMKNRPPAVQGQSGDTATFKVFADLRDMGISVDKSVELAIESGWNDRCDPPWNESQLRKKAENVDQYATHTQGRASPEADFEPLTEEEAQLYGEEDVITELNRKHAKAAMGGRVGVWVQERGVGDETFWVPYSTNEFDKLYEHRMVPQGKKMIQLGRYWRTHKKCLWSEGTTMDPEMPSGPTGHKKPFNLWQGWGLHPSPGDASPYFELVETVLASGIKKHAAYILDWLAMLVQKPLSQQKTALVFRGTKGVGKSTLGTALVKAFGQHGARIDNIESIVGRFNWHLRNKVLLVAEEIRWKTERSGEGVLKSLITDDTKQYEKKGFDTIQGRNHLSMIIIGNSDWIVPATVDERRFAVFDVPQVYKDRLDFWRRVYNVKTRGFRRAPIAAFLDELSKRDISDFEPRDIPKTQALQDQVNISQDPIEQWLLGCVDEQRLPGTNLQWPTRDISEVPTRMVFDDFRDAPNCGRITSQRFGTTLRKKYGWSRRQTRRDGERVYLYIIPPFVETRASFTIEGLEDDF